MMSEENKIIISHDELDRVRLPESTPASVPVTTAAPGQSRDWGRIHSGVGTGSTTSETPAGSFWLKAWVYLGIAGFAGALLAWAICEPAFRDGPPHQWGNVIIFPLMVVLMCVGFGLAESVVERTPQKALIRGLLALLLGAFLGFIFYYVANFVYTIGLIIVSQMGVETNRNPAFWMARATAWMIFGVAGGVVYGIVGQAFRKGLYGLVGGVIGAGIGGLLFDPIGLLFGGAVASRAVGMCLFGGATGIAMGLVESALKDRWLYVTAGPLAGKQFILYKPLTSLGSSQGNDIYLFKDASILASHAQIQLRGTQALLTAPGGTSVNGVPVSQRTLRSGDVLQIGRYTFQYHEKRQS